MNDLTNRDRKPFARTGGTADVEVVVKDPNLDDFHIVKREEIIRNEKGEVISHTVEELAPESTDKLVGALEVKEKKGSSKSTISTILMGVIGMQVMFLAYMLFYVIDDKPSPSFTQPPAIVAPVVPLQAIDVLLIQTDGSGKVLQHWEFKKTFVENANRGWLFKTDKSRVFIAPLEHYIFLENPTPEIKQQFLDDKE